MEDWDTCAEPIHKWTACTCGQHEDAHAAEGCMCKPGLYTQNRHTSRQRGHISKTETNLQSRDRLGKRYRARQRPETTCKQDIGGNTR